MAACYLAGRDGLFFLFFWAFFSAASYTPVLERTERMLFYFCLPLPQRFVLFSFQMDLRSYLNHPSLSYNLS
jgi:hypothetical protein